MRKKRCKKEKSGKRLTHEFSTRGNSGTKTKTV